VFLDRFIGESDSRFRKRKPANPADQYQQNRKKFLHKLKPSQENSSGSTRDEFAGSSEGVGQGYSNRHSSLNIKEIVFFSTTVNSE
jgi:hypothetical protein